jgi:predicted glycosyltransferase
VTGPELGAGTGSSDIRTVLLYAQDHHGLGHINRTLTIARHLLARYPSCVAYIATKSPIAGNFELPDRCDYIKLPKMLKPCTYQKDDQEVARHRFRRIRGQILRETALALAPELVLVDHEPLGSKGEFRDGLYALKAQCPTTRFVFGLRDIMDDADRIRAAWRELGVYEAFEDLYDGIAVYGSAKLFDVAEAYAIPESVRPKLHYCGYVVREAPTVDPAEVRERHQLPRNGPLVVATVGSGFDGYPVLEAACAAVERLQASVPDLHAILVTGPFMPPDQQAVLRARATSTCGVVSRADILQLMGAADAIVSMGGYNSVCEALLVARPLVIVPRETQKVEQRIRAEALASHGLARCIHPAALDGTSLAEALDWALHCDRLAHTQHVREIVPSLDGATRLTAYLSRWLGEA